MQWLDDCCTVTTFADGKGMPAINVRQPTQQQSAQILSFVPSVEGADWPATLTWQRIPPACEVASAAARAILTLAIRLDSPIA
jgi:hypothetical protein